MSSDETRKIIWSEPQSRGGVTTQCTQPVERWLVGTMVASTQGIIDVFHATGNTVAMVWRDMPHDHLAIEQGKPRHVKKRKTFSSETAARQWVESFIKSIA